MIKTLVALSLVCAAFAQSGNNGINSAPLPIPHDLCSVAASNDADLRLTVVTWGYDNAYHMAKQNSDWTAFGEFKSLGGFFVSGPTVIRNANNDIVVFGRSADMKIRYNVFHGGEDDGEWVSLGGKLLTGRVSALVDPQGLVHVFARGKDSAVWEKRQYANGTEAVWGEWVSLGGAITSNVETILDAEGIIHLFARGVDGSLYHMDQELEEDGSLVWVNWMKHDNSVLLSSAATITAKLNPQNLIEVVVRGADKAFWHTRQTVNDNRGVIWSPFKSLKGIFASAPQMAMNSDYLLTLFGRGPQRGAWYKQQAHHPVNSPSDSWSAWIPLGGHFSTSITAVPDSRGFLNIFSRGVNKQILTRSQMYSNKTVGFFGPWEDLGGEFRPFAC